MPKYVRGKWTFLAPSRRKYKKYDVFYTKDNKYVTSFGATRKNGIPYDQYKDKIGHYSKYDHKDNKRRANYHARHGKATTLTAKYFSNKFLW